MNQVSLVGRLTNDPELKYSPNGVAIVRFTLAVNRSFKQEGQPEADFVKCIAFKKTAENLVNFQKKGSLIGVEGSIQTGSYEGKDGNKVFTTDILANRVEFLSNKKEVNKQSTYNSERYETSGTFISDGKTIEVNKDDLPF